MSSSSNRTTDQPEIDVGSFTQNSEEIEQIIGIYMDQKQPIVYGRPELIIELSQECREKADEIFSLFQHNDHDLVNEEMFVNHWTRLQERISATEFFAIMDYDSSGFLSRDKFISFWRQVKKQGVSDDEIIV